jgi:hypothetical protein
MPDRLLLIKLTRAKEAVCLEQAQRLEMGSNVTKTLSLYLANFMGSAAGFLSV